MRALEYLRNVLKTSRKKSKVSFSFWYKQLRLSFSFFLDVLTFFLIKKEEKKKEIKNKREEKFPKKRQDLYFVGKAFDFTGGVLAKFPQKNVTAEPQISPFLTFGGSLCVPGGGYHG